MRGTSDVVRAVTLGAAIGIGPVLLARPLAAEGLPSGGHVTTGSATITTPGAGAMVIRQDGGKAIIDWSGFSIGAGNSVSFRNGAGATLNRVTGGDISTIAGQLNATGSVYLVNPAGVIVGPNGVVSVGGSFVASTQDLSDGRFLAGGDLTFAGTSRASVVNLGAITAQQGDVALIARAVENDGTLAAPNGTAALAAGYRVLLRGADVGAGRIEVQVGGSDTSVINRGTIRAATAELRASGGNVYALAGNRSAEINATGVAKRGGRVFLTAGAAGHVTATQKIVARAAPATSPRPETRPGGQVTITGGTITQTGIIDASARGAGMAGGTIEMIATGALSASGSLSARGGAGGSGGFVETSGQTVDFTGLRVDTSAADGTAGLWLVDPEDITVDASAAATISANLATTSVTLQTTATTASGPGTITPGAGDITIDAPISWASGTTLTLDAYHAITLNAAISPTGGGGVVLTYDPADLGNLSFGLTSAGFRGRIDYGATDKGGTLTINGAPYTLIYSMAQLDAIDGQNAVTGAGAQVLPGGDLALATSLDASGVTYTSSPVMLGGYGGTFDGLGNTVSNLSIDNSSIASLTALFGVWNGTLRDIGTIGGTIRGRDNVGGLVGSLAQYSTLPGTIAYSYSSATIDAYPDIGGWGGGYGGLAGASTGTIRNSFSTGTVSAQFTYLGGLVGVNYGDISQSFSTASATFVPPDASWDSYSYTGGLVGLNLGSISDSFAMGAVSGWKAVGGLVGESDKYNSYNPTITNSFATGPLLNVAVADTVNGQVLDYYPPKFGGVVGQNSGTVTNAYFDTQTSGTSFAYDGGTGLTTAQLQGTLPAGFSSATWGTGPGLYPYLKDFAPNGVSAVTGNVYRDHGVAYSVQDSRYNPYPYKDTLAVPTGLGSQNTIRLDGGAAARVALDAGGARMLAGSVAANGSYYLFAPADMTGAGTDLVVSAPGDSVSQMSAAARVVVSTATTAAPVTTADLQAGFLSAPTDAATLASAPSLASLRSRADAASGGQTQALLAGLDAPGYVTTAPRFDVDTAHAGAGFLVQTGAGAPISIKAPVTVTGGSGLTLLSGGTLDIGAPVTLQGASPVVLGYDSSDLANLGFGLTRAGFDGAIDYGASDLGGTLAINRKPYALIYTASALAGLVAADENDLALATGIDASGVTQGGPLVTIPYFGTFTGLGHVIRGGQFGGLFAQQNNNSLPRVIRDLGFEDGTVSNGAVAQSFVGTIIGVYSGDAVNGGSSAGGLVGAMGATGTTIRNSFATGPVSGVNDVGGLVGLFSTNARIENSFATGDVTGGSQVGGLIGRLENGAQVVGSFASGAVTASGANVGGLVGASASAALTDVYATGTVQGGGAVGGLIGSSTGDTILNAYAAGAVGGTGTTGGLAGVASGSSASASFYDSTATGQTSDAVGATPLTTAQFMDTAGFMAASGWDFANVWSPPGAGYHPQLYAVNPVVWVQQTAASATYGDATGQVTGVAVQYGGPASYAFDLPGATLDLSGASLATDPTRAVGSYASALPTGNTSADSTGGVPYRVFYHGSQSLTVTPRAITVTADAASRAYGDANPALGWSVGGAGLVNGDGLSGALTTGATRTSGIGGYAITQGTLAASANYTLSFTPGTLTITPRAITVTADTATRAYGDANPALGWSVGGAGLVNGDGLSGALTTGATRTSGIGGYAITQGTLAASANYALSFTPGTLTVTPRALTITADAASRVYGDPNPASGTATGAGLVNGDTLGSVTLGSAADATSGVGRYDLNASDAVFASGSAANYAISYATRAGGLTITPRPITVTADTATRAYGDTNPALGWSVGGAGLVNGDGLSGALTTGATQTSGIGGYAITQGTLAASANYALSFTPGTLTVTPRALTITADDRTKTYGDTLILGTQDFTAAGLVNGDTVTGVSLSAGGLAPLDLPGDYAITPGAAVGTGLANYAIRYAEGTLTVALPDGFVPMPPIGPRPGPGARHTGSQGTPQGGPATAGTCGAGTNKVPCANLPYAANWQAGPNIRFEAN